MGAPRRNRTKFDKPKDIWNLQRINADNALKDEYALKNMKELWKVQSNISRIRGNVRLLLSGSAPNRQMEANIISSLSKYGIVSNTAKLDDLLDLKVNSFLERRLQSIVFRKGMARSMRQARQLIAHGFIAVNGKKASRPGRMLTSEEEQHISYYKPIDVNVNVKVAPAQKVAEMTAEEPAAAAGAGQSEETASTEAVIEQGEKAGEEK